jgi:tRNA pseudouridine38/39 synthase
MAAVGSSASGGRKSSGRVPYAMPALLAKHGYSRCGRTDAGVSALGQVVALNLRSNFPLDDGLTKLPAHPNDGVWVDFHRAQGESFAACAGERGAGDDPAHDAGAGAAGEASRKGGRRSEPGRANKDGQPVGLQLVRELDYVSLLNAALPPDVRAVAWAPVSEHFSARFSCEHRTYRYFFVRRQLDLAAMATAAKHLVKRGTGRGVILVVKE